MAVLTFTDTFAAGASLYGVADLELLARDTHKFESRYLDGLVGPWPEAAALYGSAARCTTSRLRCPVILFQGEEDTVVPRGQADAIYAALRDRGVPVAYLLFAGEQHGFRQASTIPRWPRPNWPSTAGCWGSPPPACRPSPSPTSRTSGHARPVISRGCDQS